MTFSFYVNKVNFYNFPDYGNLSLFVKPITELVGVLLSKATSNKLT